MITEHQKQSLLKSYTQWADNQEQGFDLDNINRWLRDYKGFVDYFYETFDKYNQFYAEKTEDNFNSFLENVYNAVNTQKKTTSNQTLDELKNYGYWDINAGSLTVTICLDRKNFDMRVSDYFNGYAKIGREELFEPFEDMEYTTLKYFAEEELQKTQVQMLARIENLIEKPLYDELSAYEQGIRDMINFLNNRDYATSQGVYFHILDTFLYNHAKEFKVW